MSVATSAVPPPSRTFPTHGLGFIRAGWPTHVQEKNTRNQARFPVLRHQRLQRYLLQPPREEKRPTFNLIGALHTPQIDKHANKHFSKMTIQPRLNTVYPHYAEMCQRQREPTPPKRAADCRRHRKVTDGVFPNWKLIWSFVLPENCKKYKVFCQKKSKKKL